MIIVTGGAGFIGSALVKSLNESGREDILIVDNLGKSEKWKNLVNLKFNDYIHKKRLFRELKYLPEVDTIYHLGACSSTTEDDGDYLYQNNFRYSRRLAEFALNNGIRFIYASSAATYGAGEQGYSDSDLLTHKLKPLNRYGYSKLLMDKWILRHGLEAGVCGLRFFNVFGPNEYHKGSMKSMVYKGFEQIEATGSVKLFKSNHPNFADGEQQRDFIYVKDVVKVIKWLGSRPEVNGIFNVGTGIAHSWKDLMQAAFAATGQPENIEFIEMPEKLKGAYQNYTCAIMDKLRNAGYTDDFMRLQDSVADYINNYLQAADPYL